eukprot:6119427-Amphidinium_carterae.1
MALRTGASKLRYGRRYAGAFKVVCLTSVLCSSKLARESCLPAATIPVFLAMQRTSSVSGPTPKRTIWTHYSVHSINQSNATTNAKSDQ